MPKITVIMNCLNGEKLIRNAIESVYAQTFQDWEIIFWDNASTDATAAIAKSFDDGRLRYFRSEKTVPLGQARQWAIAEARGEWLTLLDYDDAFMPQFFEKHMAAIGDGDYTLSYSGYRDVDDNDNLLRNVMPQNKSGYLLPSLLMHYDINTATVMMQRKCLEEFTRGRTSSFVGAEDYFLYLSLAARGEVCVVPEILATYRVASSSWTERALDLHSSEYHQTLDQLERDLPGITERHREAFAFARARAEYAQAKYLMHVGRYAEARKIMASIRHFRRAFAGLHMVSYIPPLWALIHRRTIKSRLTGLVMGRSNSRKPA